MAYNIEAKVEGLKWEKVLAKNKPLQVRRRYLRFDSVEEAQAAADERLKTHQQECRVVPAIGD